ncbi:enoyl-CoA hydratase/isomerase family protein [Xanthobacter sp. KR7-225]|uniref:enoyl-CoA hydratase/isomerase family protein n=1 Tax=Xanthobacter sp. KR7-225 TaxID=3156613 RepID=UPI0032B543A9
MSSFETIRVERRGPALIFHLARPERRNAVSLKMMAEIIAATEAAEDDAAARAIILYGGADYFSAGADLTEAVKIKTATDGTRYFKQWHALNAALENSAKPVIAAIEGFCMTGGLELALAADLRVAGEGASFAITSARIGTVAGAGGTQRLPRVVGPSNALDMLFAAEPIDAAEALRIGLVNRVTARGGALDKALEMAALYATRAPLSLAFVKRAVHRGMQMDLASAIEFETFLVTTVYGTRDKQEGITAFLEKRPATFTGA